MDVRGLTNQILPPCQSFIRGIPQYITPQKFMSRLRHFCFSELACFPRRPYAKSISLKVASVSILIMIWLKVAGYFLVWMFVLDSSSAFLPPTCDIKLDPTKLFEGNVEPKDVLKGAVCVGSLLQANYGLLQKFPTTQKFIQNLIQHGTSVITDNPAYFGASVYFTAVLVVSHVYAIEAKMHLMEAKFEQDDLNLAIDAEIIHILRFIDTILIKKGTKNGLKSFCSMKVFLKDTIDSAVDNVQKVRKNIEKNMQDSKRGEENNSLFQKLSAGAGTLGAIGIAAAPCPFTAFFACPALVAGTAMALSGAGGYHVFGNSKLTHEQTFKVLEQARVNAMVVEEALRTARVNSGLACAQFLLCEQSGINQLE